MKSLRVFFEQITFMWAFFAIMSIILVVLGESGGSIIDGFLKIVESFGFVGALSGVFAISS